MTEGPGLSFTGSFARALLIFATLEALGSFVCARVILPTLVQATDASHLSQLRDQIALVIYGTTAVAAGLASWWIARTARRRRQGLMAGVVAVVLGVATALGSGACLAAWVRQPIIKETLLAHGLVAVAAIVAGTIGGGLMPGLGRPSRQPARGSASTLTAAFLCALLGLPVVPPLGTSAAEIRATVEPTPTDASKADIEPATCGVVSIKGNLDGALTLFSVDVAPGFGFEATRNLDQSWDLETTGSLEAGFKFEAGTKGPKIGGLAGLANLDLSITNDGIGKVRFKYHLASDEQLVDVVAGSLATFAWHVESLPGLSLFLSDLPVAPPKVSLPPASETTVDLGGVTKVELGIGPASQETEVQSGLRIRTSTANKPTVAIGVLVSGKEKAALDVVPVGDNSGSVDGELYAYVTFSQSSDGWLPDSIDVSASGELALSGELASRAVTTVTELTIATVMIARTARGVGAFGVIQTSVSKSSRKLGLSLEDGVSVDLNAHLDNLTDPQVGLAMLRILLFAVRPQDQPIVERLYPAIGDLSSVQQLVDSFETLVQHSRMEMFAHGSISAELGLKASLGDGAAFGFEVTASGGVTVLTNAFFGNSDVGIRESRTCVAPSDLP